MPAPRSPFRERLGTYLLGVAIGCVIAGFIVMGKYQAKKRQTGPPASLQSAPSLTSSPPASPAALTPIHILAAMPLEAESVWVQNIPKLYEDAKTAQLLNSTWAEVAKEVESDANAAIIDGVLKAGPLFHAVGGSCFTAPADLGVGPFNRREVWVVKESLASLKGRVLNPASPFFVRMERDGESPVCRAKSKLAIYGQPDKEVSICFGFAGDRAVVVADSAIDAAHMLDRLNANQVDAPKRWSGMLDDEMLEAASFIVRSYDPSRIDSLWQLANPPANDLPSAHRLRMIIKDANSLPVTQCWTTDIDNTKLMLSFCMSEPRVEPVTGGLIAKAWNRGNDDDHGITIILMPMMLFGQVIAI
jgi:hypothetical protein